MVRLAALGLIHEVNTFSIHMMDEETIQNTGVLFGDDIVAKHRSGTTTMSGDLATGDVDGVEVVPRGDDVSDPAWPDRGWWRWRRSPSWAWAFAAGLYW